MNELLREFFYDGICRIIPGLVVIGFYGRQLLRNGFDSLQVITNDHSLVILIPCVLLAAWFIGVMVDILTLVPFWFLWRKLVQPRLDSASRLEKLKWLSILGQNCFRDDWHLITKPGADVECRQRMKQLAEKLFCRVMFFILLYTLFCPPPPFFQCHQWNTCHAIIGAIIFFMGWVWTSHWLNEWRKEATKPKGS